MSETALLRSARAALQHAAANYAESANSIGATSQSACADLDAAAIDFVRARLLEAGTPTAMTCAQYILRML